MNFSDEFPMENIAKEVGVFQASSKEKKSAQYCYEKVF